MTTTTENNVAQEPVTKKQKLTNDADLPVDPAKVEVSDWADHTLNVNFCIMKESEGKMFTDIARSDCDILEGLGDKSKALMELFGVETVADLAEYKFYKIAKVCFEESSRWLFLL